MSDLRIRPKSDFINTATWQELYVLTEHWQSDLEFFGDELEFLNQLISKYLLLLVRKESIAKVQQMISGIDRLKKLQMELASSTKSHQHHLKDVITSKLIPDEIVFREEHVVLEDNITFFYKDFRLLKKEIFTITEHVMKKEKLQHLLTS